VVVAGDAGGGGSGFYAFLYDVVYDQVNCSVELLLPPDGSASAPVESSN